MDKKSKQMKQQIETLEAREKEIETKRSENYKKLRELKEQYSKVANKDLIGKCFKIFNRHDEAEDENDEDAYWTYLKVTGLLYDDKCLVQQFDLRVDDKYHKAKERRMAFSLIKNEDTHICFLRGSNANLDYIEITEKQYKAALDKCLDRLCCTKRPSRKVIKKRPKF
jgi:hypothetical protein